ncbi:MAG: hypothetical protein B6245_02855 [Desulfobacteraceae bacterium 4572_88]|nr:MAG: hypothetical protein B6245_02855 [Desulfobacteraceae bacterium 4572_88]
MKIAPYSVVLNGQTAFSNWPVLPVFYEAITGVPAISFCRNQCGTAIRTVKKMRNFRDFGNP